MTTTMVPKFALALAACAALAACGFRPAYAPGGAGAALDAFDRAARITV